MKNRTLLFRTGIIVIITLIALYLVFGPRNSFTANDFSWSGIKNNLATNINLGLDLRGGSHLVMRVKVEEYLKKLTENNGLAAQTAAQQANPPLPVSEPKFVTTNGNYQITLPVTDPGQKQAVVDAVKQKVDFSLWSQSETNDAIVWSLPITAQRTLSDQAVEQALRIIEGRINSFGVKEPTLARQGGQDSQQILLQMPGVEDPERVKKLIGETAQLSLMKVVSPPNPSPVQTYPTKKPRCNQSADRKRSRERSFHTPTATTRRPTRKIRRTISRRALSSSKVRRLSTAASCAKRTLIRRAAATAITRFRLR